MTRRMGVLTLLLALSVATFLPASYGQVEISKPEQYSAVVVGTGGSVGARSRQFDFRIERYTSDQDLNSFRELLRTKGQDALRRALEDENVGRIYAVGGTGNQIAVARKEQVGSETMITIVTARSMGFVELYQGGRSTSYPFGFMQVKLNEKGQGGGQMMAAAQLRFNKKTGKYEIESYGNPYLKVVNVRPWK
jgi:hypothetical protein